MCVKTTPVAGKDLRMSTMKIHKKKRKTMAMATVITFATTKCNNTILTSVRNKNPFQKE